MGVLAIANVGTYSGQFKEDVEHGSGILVMENGDKYEGDWLFG